MGPGDSSEPSEFKQGCSDPPAAASGRQEGAGEEKTDIAPAATATVSQPVQRLEPCFNLWHRPRSHSLGGRPAEGAVQPWRRVLIQSELTKIHGSIQPWVNFFLIIIVNNSCNLPKPFNTTFKSSNIFEDIC